MKKVTIPTEPQEIDWSKRQWVVSTKTPNLIVLTTGEHVLDVFTGMGLPCACYPNGEYAQKWSKECFHLLTTDIPFTISNKD